MTRSAEILASAESIFLYPFRVGSEASLLSDVSDSGSSARNAGNVMSRINCGFDFATWARTSKTLSLV
jgi:hypothetical protein